MRRRRLDPSLALYRAPPELAFGAPAGRVGDAGYDDDAPAAAAPAAVAVAAAPPPGYFDPEDLPYLATTVIQGHDETDERFFRRRVLALVDDRRDVYLRWAYDRARAESWSWCSWLAKQWRAFRPLGRAADALLPTYTRTIDDAVLRNVSAAVVANQENATANPRYQFYTKFERDNTNASNNALRWEDHLSNAFEVARASVKGLGKTAEATFADDMFRLERALRRHQILLEHYINTGEREMRTGQASERFVITALRSGRIAELVRAIAELPWPAVDADKFARDGYCGNVTVLVRQIIALCPEEMGRARDDRGRVRPIVYNQLPAASVHDQPDEIAYRALAYYTTLIMPDDVAKEDELYRYGAYYRTKTDGRVSTYAWRHFLRAELCGIIFDLLRILRPDEGGEIPALVEEAIPLLMKQLEIARVEAVDLFFPVSVADRIDAVTARVPNFVSLVGAGAIVALEFAGGVHEALVLAQTRNVDEQVARLVDGAAREDIAYRTATDLTSAWTSALDAEFEQGRVEGTATTAAYHLIPQKLKHVNPPAPAGTREFYGQPLARLENDTWVDSDYWFDRRAPVRIMAGANARALDVEIYTAVRMHVKLRRGEATGGDVYASLSQLSSAMDRDYATVKGRNVDEMASPISVQIKIKQDQLKWRASKCHKLAVVLTRLQTMAKQTTGTPQAQIAEAMRNADADLRTCAAESLPADAPVEIVAWLQNTLHYLTIGYMPVPAMWQALLSYLTGATSTYAGLGKLLRMINDASNPASDYYMASVVIYSTFAAMAVGTLSLRWVRHGMWHTQGMCKYLAKNAAYYFGITAMGLAKYGLVYGAVAWQANYLSNAWNGWENAHVPDGAAAFARNLWHCARPTVFLGDGWNTCVARLEHEALVHTTAMAVTRGAYSSEFMAQLLAAIGRQGITDDAVTQSQLRAAIDATAAQYASSLNSDKPNSDYGDALVAAMQKIMSDRIQGRFASSEARRMSWCDSVSRTMVKVGAAMRQVGLVGETLRSGAAAGFGLARVAFSLGKFATFPKLAAAAVNIGLGRCMRRADRAGGRSVNAMVSADALGRVLGAVSLSNASLSEEEKRNATDWEDAYQRYKNAPDGPAKVAARRELTLKTGALKLPASESRLLLRRARFDNLMGEAGPATPRGGRRRGVVQRDLDEALEKAKADQAAAEDTDSDEDPRYV